ncbi:10702_t:CDS:2, partial [Racocetra fulgida]
KPNAESWLEKNENLVIFLVGIVLGIMFIIDGEISVKTQKANELFKETLKKFSILAIFGALCPYFISGQITASPREEIEKTETNLDQLDEKQDQILDTVIQSLNEKQAEINYWKNLAE